jgi:DNA-binding NarL/FixJ family response regulator
MKQVLIVDDSSQVRQRIAERLTEFPQVRIVGEAGNAREAVEAVSRVKPDMVILDICLPDQNGIALLSLLKICYPDTAVVILTDLDDSRYRQTCLNLGADFFLSKALDIDRIVDTITGFSEH